MLGVSVASLCILVLAVMRGCLLMGLCVALCGVGRSAMGDFSHGTGRPTLSDGPLPIRLGFVGVGGHARKLRDAMINAGAVVVAHDRSKGSDAESHAWGRRLSWQRQLSSPDIDAVVCAATPDIALAVAELAAKTGKRVCVSKPLRWPHAELPPNIWVDLWRLYAPSWLARKAEAAAAKSLEISACGHGPWRSTHSGLEDYGPHALAFALDAARCDSAGMLHSAKHGYHTFEAQGVTIICGAGIEHHTPNRREWHIKADGQTLWRDELERTAALENFAEAFLRGDAHRTLELSCAAMRVIGAVR